MAALALAIGALTALPGLAFAEPSVEPISPLKWGHWSPAAAPLPGGEVLVSGGYFYLDPHDSHGSASKVAEIFDPATGEFTPVSSEMTSRRYVHTAVALGDGTVLIAGGLSASYTFMATASAEIYDPSSGEFAGTGSMSVPRQGPFSASLPDGTALVGGGGCGYCTPDRAPVTFWASTEIYDPGSGEFTPGPAMATPRRDAGAAPLPDGRILVMGGSNGSETLSSTEILDPVSGSFEPGPAMPVSSVHTATALDNGRVLVIGGSPEEIFEYDPESETFIETGISGTPYRGASAAPLPDGRALLAGSGGSAYGTGGQAWIYLGAPVPVRGPTGSGEPIDATSGLGGGGGPAADAPVPSPPPSSTLGSSPPVTNPAGGRRSKPVRRACRRNHESKGKHRKTARRCIRKAAVLRAAAH